LKLLNPFSHHEHGMYAGIEHIYENTEFYNNKFSFSYADSRFHFAANPKWTDRRYDGQMNKIIVIDAPEGL
jgi:hypothetical protein